MSQLDMIAQRIQADFEARNDARDQALRRTRELIRTCATAIRASHRDEWDAAHDLLAEADRTAEELQEALIPYPDLLYAGYTQDALKELVEAHVTFALASNTSIPEPEALDMCYSAYLNGLCEGASEMRRRCLDEMRRGDTAEAERLLKAMDEIYDILVTFDFPDAITGGLRRRVDQLRGVLERTRGDLTNSLRQDRLVQALEELEERVNSE
jgi:translin